MLLLTENNSSVEKSSRDFQDDSPTSYRSLLDDASRVEIIVYFSHFLARKEEIVFGHVQKTQHASIDKIIQSILYIYLGFKEKTKSIDV